MESLATSIKRRAALLTEIADLKNRKVELERLIRVKEEALPRIDFDMEYSTVMPVDGISEDLARAASRRAVGCYEMLRARIRNHMIDAPWGHMLRPFDEVDGEYYLFMNGVDYFCYYVFLAGGNPEKHLGIMWKEDYGSRDCMSSTCWYEMNLDRRKEFKCNYVIPENERTRYISVCDVDYENGGCNESREYFSDLVEEYKSRADPKQRHACEMCKQTFFEECMFECKKCAAPNICEYCWDDKMHECYICEENGCSACTIKRRGSDFVVHKSCIMPEERGDYE